jgi:hypothetical protein
MARKKKLTFEQKVEYTKLRVKMFKNAMGLKNWKVNVDCSGDWSWNVDHPTAAQTSNRSKYLSATIEFHKRFIEEYTGTETHDEIILHEIFHVLHAKYHRLLLDTMDIYEQALSKSINQRFTLLDEEFAVKVAGSLIKGVVKPWE